MNNFKILFLSTCLLGLPPVVRAQKTANLLTQAVQNATPITLSSAEADFLNKNLLLLAQKYNIEASQALEIQAKLYPNPNVQIGNTIYDPTHKKVFPLPGSFPSGELTATVSQEIVLAGKLNKALKLAQATTQLNQGQFFDLIRTLKYALRTDFYNIYFMQQSIKVYDEELASLRKIVDAYNAQEGKNYVSEKEVIRIKALLYSLETEKQALTEQINDAESDLRLLLHADPETYYLPQVNESELLATSPVSYPLMTLVDSAMTNRSDLQIARYNTQWAQANLSYQKALAVPNLTASVAYDQQGSMVNHLTSWGLAMDLPFFNRNQGNIKNAQSLIKANETAEQSVQQNVEESVYRAYQKAIDAHNLYQKTDPGFGEHFDQLMQAALNNYRQRNIPILDFLDFYDSYKQNVLQINSIKYAKVLSLENINYVTGTEIFK